MNSSQRPLRILASVKDDAAFYYRVGAPFRVLAASTEHDWHIGTAAPERAKEYDVLWMQQNVDTISAIVAGDFLKAGKAIVYDVDDWLFNLPPSWDGVSVGQLAVHKRLLAMATLVTTTTEYLAGKLRQILPGKPIVVLPNCVLQEDWDLIPEKTHGRDGPVLGWFGTVNHWDDWYEIAPIVSDALSAVGGYLALIGPQEMMSCFSGELTKRTLFLPMVRMSEFSQVRAMIKAFDVGLAWATTRTQASNCRSPLKAYQYGAASVPCIASQNVYGDILHDAVLLVDDLHTLQATIMWALENINSLKQAGKSWQHAVYRLHSYETQSRQWLKAAIQVAQLAEGRWQ